jgi:hypothetical protein
MNDIPDELSVGDTSQTERRILDEISAVSPGLHTAAVNLLRKIVTPNWTLEWGMPRWLGETFNLEEKVIDELVLANAYMLAYIRLADDLADGDEPASSLGLALVIYHLWTRRYLRLFDEVKAGSTRAFWTYFDDCMTRWLGATVGTERSGPALQSYTEADYLLLADRGASLKIACAAACTIANSEAAIAELGAAVDDIMIGVVLLDDAFDWRTDLEAGRYNALVAFCSDLPQTRQHLEANRRAVLHEMNLGGTAQPYFAIIGERMESSKGRSQSVGCRRLVRFADWYRQEAAACGVWMRDQAVSRVCDFAARHAWS